MKHQTATIVAILGAFVCLATLDAALAQNDGAADVDALIGGFEDGAPAGDDLEDAVRGFEQTPAQAMEPPPEEDDILRGFEPDAAADMPPSPEAIQPSPLSLEGEFSFTTLFGLSPDAHSPWGGLNMVRPELELILKSRFSDKWQGQISARGVHDPVYAIRGRDDYSLQVLDEYEEEFELKDTFVQGSLTNALDAKIGRQTVVWGTLDNIRATDVLNPLDRRLPGLTDIEDLRLPVTMAKFDYYVGSWDLSGMAIPEVRFSKLPAFGSDFFPSPSPLPQEDAPDDGLENAQYAAALTGVFSGWDIAFYWADIYADQSYVESVSREAADQFIRRYSRIKMLGTAANLAAGNWLLKAEAACFDGLRYTNRPHTDHVRLDLATGVEYAGFSEAAVSLEAVNRHLFDYDSLLEQAPDAVRRDAFQWALRITRDLLNDTLTLGLLAAAFGFAGEDGAFERLDAEYDITDAVSIRTGAVVYQSGEKGQLKEVGGNDRLFAVLTYHF